MSDLLVEDILAPLVRYLRTSEDLQKLSTLVPEGGVNPILGPPFVENGEPVEMQQPLWIFRSNTTNGYPPVNVEGTGSSAITLAHADEWARKNKGHTLIFPTIKVFYHCDATRESEINAPEELDGRDKCLTLHKAVCKMMHNKKGPGGFMYWGAEGDLPPLRVVSSYSGIDLKMDSRPELDGMVEGYATFELEVHL